MPYKNLDEKRRADRDGKRRRRALKAKPNPFAIVGPGFQPPTGSTSISLRSTADCLTVLEQVATIAQNATDEQLDLCTRLRVLLMCAATASRCQDANAFEERVAELERQAERVAS